MVLELSAVIDHLRSHLANVQKFHLVQHTEMAQTAGMHPEAFLVFQSVRDYEECYGLRIKEPEVH